MSGIATRLADVKARIAQACERANRRPDDVTLVAVSKGQPAEAIAEAYAAGQRDFGENYAQELRDKAQALKLDGIRWHFLGALQTNKVKYVAPVTSVFHALDRLELAEALSKKVTAPMDVLLEVNVGGETQKHGVAPASVATLLEQVRALGGLRVVGLMCIPPAATAEEARPHFRSLRVLAQQLGLPRLSMGMSADYVVAIEEGATMVRVGTSIFGERKPRGTETA